MIKIINRAFNFSLNQLNFYSTLGGLTNFTTLINSSNIDLDLRNIEWFTLDEKGFIQDTQVSFEDKAAVYIYQLILDDIL